MKLRLAIFALVCIPSIVFAQLNLHPTNGKDQWHLMDMVLKDTDHGYIGFEVGLLVDLSPTYFQNPNHANYAYNGFDIGSGYFSPVFRIFAGYKWRSNYFELGFSNISSMAKAQYSATSYSMFSRDFITLQ